MDIEASPVRNKKKAGSVASQISCQKANDRLSFWQQPQMKPQHRIISLVPFYRVGGSRSCDLAMLLCQGMPPHSHSLQLPDTDVIYLPPSVASAEMSCGNWVGASILQGIIQEMWGKPTS